MYDRDLDSLFNIDIKFGTSAFDFRREIRCCNLFLTSFGNVEDFLDCSQPPGKRIDATACFFQVHDASLLFNAPQFSNFKNYYKYLCREREKESCARGRCTFRFDQNYDFHSNASNP